MQKYLLHILFAAGLMVCFSLGCTKKPNQEELNKLTEARNAADAAEKKLAELRTERAQLEATLESKKEELRKAESERDSIKAKLGQ